MRQQLLGDNHPHVALSLNNLAGLYRSQGRYTEAEPLYLGLAERICNLYRKRLLAELRVAQVQGNLLKSLKTLAPSLSSTNVPQSRATPNLTRKLRVSLAGEIIPRQSLGYHGQSNSLVRI